MQAAGHEVVHEVVARCDGIEHAANARGLFLGGDLLVAKIDGFHGLPILRVRPCGVRRVMGTACSSRPVAANFLWAGPWRAKVPASRKHGASGSRDGRLNFPVHAVNESSLAIQDPDDVGARLFVYRRVPGLASAAIHAFKEPVTVFFPNFVSGAPIVKRYPSRRGTTWRLVEARLSRRTASFRCHDRL